MCSLHAGNLFAYSIRTAAAAPRMGASSLASAVGAMARPVEVEVEAEVVVKTRVVGEMVVPGMVVAARVVWLLVVPGMVVAGSVVPDSTEVTVVLTGTVVVSVVSELVVVLAPVPVVLLPVTLDATDEAWLSMLLATDEACEATLEAMALPEAMADEISADTDEMMPPTDWPRDSPAKRPRATTARVLTFIVRTIVVFFLLYWRLREREEEERECV